MKRAPSPFRQRGATTMLIALMVLLSLALIGMTGTRLIMTQHRISANAARADAAFAAAEAGIQNALVYLRPNRSVMNDVHLGGWDDSSSEVKWADCSVHPTDIPCGNGTTNLYGTGWQVYGPVPNQTAASSDYTVTTYYLSNSLDTADLDLPNPGCTTLSLTASPPLPTATVTAVGLVNTILAALGLGSIQPTMCLPINFSQMPWGTRSSSGHPSVTIVSAATPATDPSAGASAVVQQVVATTNLFYDLPPAAIMANGTVNLNGDIRIWGNPRPPTVSPMDFSVLNLNDVAGYNVTSLLNARVGTLAGSISSAVNVSFAPVLNVTSADVLGFDWNVTFPLSIWSASTTTLNPTTYALLATVQNAKTCVPPHGGAASSPCTPLSQNVSATAALLGTRSVALKLPDIQDPSNVTTTTVVSGLLGISVPAFPADLFDFTFGAPSAQSSRISTLATAVTDCSSVGSDGFYWVTGNCTMTGNVGSASAPVVVVATGNLTLGNGTDFYGVIYLRGSSAKTVTGWASGQRPTIHGALLSEGAISGTSNFNVVYDVNAIRKAGYRSGGFAPVPGGWNDAITGP